MIQQISADYKRIDPADSAYFDQQKQNYERHGLARYHQLIADIKNRYSGTPIGASESIVTPLAEDLGLQVATPESALPRGWRVVAPEGGRGDATPCPPDHRGTCSGGLAIPETCPPGEGTGG